MDIVVYVLAAGLLVVLIAIISYLRKSSASAPAAAPVQNVGANQRAARAANVAGGVRRGGARRRMHIAAAHPHADHDSEDEDFDEDAVEATDQEGKKIGAKKLKKNQEKAERRAQREAEEEEREERKRRAEKLEEQRKKEQAQREAEEKAKEEGLRAEREVEERRQHEEYLKLKETFTVEEEGEDENQPENTESLLEDFINYIKDMKVVMLEDLASHFKMKAADAIARVTELLEQSRLSGVMDDRGKFIYITTDEYQAVAKFIKQRGRVSISELAESSNRLINLNPDNSSLHQQLVSTVV